MSQALKTRKAILIAWWPRRSSARGWFRIERYQGTATVEANLGPFLILAGDLVTRHTFQVYIAPLRRFWPAERAAS